MSNRKMLMSVTASAAIASAIFVAEEAEAATHTVKSGDSLWTIAQKYNTTVSSLKSFNDLSSDVIHPKQKIKTSKASSSSGSNSEKNNVQSSSSSSKSTYVVKAGDTLSGIAYKHKVSMSDLMKWNDLDTTLIFPGNEFIVSKKASNSSSNSSESSSSSSGSSSSSSTYTVKSGDTLSHIALSEGVSVANIKKWNNLNSDLIHVGKKLKIKGSSSGSNSGSSGSGSGSSGSSGGGKVGSAKVYTVKSGDSLSKIAVSEGVTVAKLKSWNNLKSDLLRIGQKLSINGKKSSGSSGSGSSGSPADVDYNVDTLIKEAKRQKGVPYVWAGESPSGFDCSGFIHYVYNKAGLSMGRTSTDGYYNRSYHVNHPKIGDLVFFSGTYRSGISHMGIYLGNGNFIHAGTSTGVTISNVNTNPYWSKHFDSYKRFY